jgi:hypothetical protein
MQFSTCIIQVFLPHFQLVNFVRVPNDLYRSRFKSSIRVSLEEMTENHDFYSGSLVDNCVAISCYY